MKCPICGSEATVKDESYWCDTDQIYLGVKIDSKLVEERVDEGATYRRRATKHRLKVLLGFLIILLILTPPVVYLVLNFTAFGYREKVFYYYGFTNEATSYMRNETSINVLLLNETKPFGFVHAGYYQYGSKAVTLNSANDEIAIHEFAHAWWDLKGKDRELRSKFIDDTLQLADMSDPEYAKAIDRAKKIVAEFCYCPSETINDRLIDDQHFYAHLAQFTMGKFKDGPHKLPEFMWPYFETMFTGNVRGQTCYETNSCYYFNN